MQTLKRAYVFSSTVFTGFVFVTVATFLLALLFGADWTQALERQVQQWWRTGEPEALARTEEGTEEGTEEDLVVTLRELPARRDLVATGLAQPVWDTTRVPLCGVLNRLLARGDSSWKPLSTDDPYELERRLPEIRRRLDEFGRREDARQAWRQMAPHTLVRMLRYYPDTQALEVLEALGAQLGPEVLERMSRTDPKRAAELARFWTHPPRNDEEP